MFARLLPAIGCFFLLQEVFRNSTCQGKLERSKPPTKTGPHVSMPRTAGPLLPFAGNLSTLESLCYTRFYAGFLGLDSAQDGKCSSIRPGSQGCR